MFSTIKMAIAIMLITGIAGAGMYVMKLRADNATLKANQSKLESAITEQNKVLEQQKKDFTAILESNKKLNTLINTFKIGKLALQRTKSIERIVNKGGKNAARCIELASGAERTEEELKATLKSQINPECPALANPNYVPFQ